MTALRIYLEDVFTNINIHEALARLIVTGIVVLLWIIAATIVVALMKKYVTRTFKRRKGDIRGTTLSNLTVSTLKVLIWFVTILAIISEIGFEITPILAAAGILGLAIGFGAQHLVSDIVSGFFLIVDNAYNIGEDVDIDGFRGDVVYMNLRVTHVKNWLGSVLIINNGQINKLINWSRNNSTAVVDFGVAYETDLEKFNALIPEFVENLESRYDVITEPATFLGVTELADSSINMRIIAKTRPGDQFGLERKIRHDLVVYLTKHDIEIPFPQVVVSQKETSNE